MIAADVRLIEGEVLLDQSMITGESVPIEAGAGGRPMPGRLFAAARLSPRLRRPEPMQSSASSAELIRSAHVVSSQQKAVLRVVRNLAAFNGVIIVMLVGYADYLKMPLREIIPLVLTAVLASIPVALPATFTLASALGARALGKARGSFNPPLRRG